MIISNKSNLIYSSAPPANIAYKNLANVEEDQDFESGNVTFRLDYDGGFNANWTAQCEQTDTRPAATVTWMIGNKISILIATLLIYNFEKGMVTNHLKWIIIFSR